MKHHNILASILCLFTLGAHAMEQQNHAADKNTLAAAAATAFPATAGLVYTLSTTDKPQKIMQSIYCRIITLLCLQLPEQDFC